MMKLDGLLQVLDGATVTGSVERNVSDICYDSRRCGKDSLFVAITGHKFDGHRYIEMAIKQGASCIVHEHEIPFREDIAYVKVADSRRALGRLGRAFFGNPTAELCLVGITGTKGKTTISYLLESTLEAAGKSVGVIGTITSRYGNEVHESSITTPESIDLQRMFRRMVAAGVTHCVMEVSSHALDQGRVADCMYDLGIFTNLSQDHLDYHLTMEEYYCAKRRFFLDILVDERKAIINGDDPWGRRLIDETGGSPVTYGLDRAWTVSAQRFDLSLGGIRGEIVTPEGAVSVSSPLVGTFNLYNILASVAAAVSMRISMDAVMEGIKRLRAIPGRFQKVNRNGEPAVFVDYAHTENALRNVLETVVRFKTHKIITVFGCGGDRDRGKRPLMGKVAADMSDLAIVTSDNPRTEDPLDIIAQIESGIKGGSVGKVSLEGITPGGYDSGYAVIPDRREAILTAISIAGPEDIVLIAGKGHENYQIIGETKIFFDDTVVAGEALERRRLEMTG
ncbi:MAG: UDP-N-acetylmuramoyl-L-alanyl-D-glutamate--2,6-diaminopimelate ligase [Deltaproteobacteria bacterium]|nr:UDP-N-acetylmuramoyl-L-alanyl-D-glutamate--2,6-diaminopimelate ligase [Deltaproteobacteria bacterium]